MIDSRARFVHTPVMVDEVVTAVGRAPSGVFVDATLGGAGHAGAVLAARSDLELHGFDQDPTAVEAARRALARWGDRSVVHTARFDRIGEELATAGVDRIAGFLMDLGVSSPQIDRPERGFSYRADGPLDMRMDPASPLRAADVVNGYSTEELIDVLRAYGDERYAAPIARSIVAARPLTTTFELVDAVIAGMPARARRQPGHPAKRTFQAIRIEVNAELAILGPSLDALIERLAPGGVGLVLTYHSGEDRIVKDRMRRAVEGSDLPGMEPTSPFGWLWRGARRPTDAEIEANPRAKSARLRAVVRREGP